MYKIEDKVTMRVSDIHIYINVYAHIYAYVHICIISKSI